MQMEMKMLKWYAEVQVWTRMGILDGLGHTHEHTHEQRSMWGCATLEGGGEACFHLHIREDRDGSISKELALQC